MSNFTQDTRLLDLQTPLGKDALLIRSIQGTEAISQLYTYEIDCFGDSETPVNFNDLIGQPVYVQVNVSTERHKFFHGIVRSLTRGIRSRYQTSYRMEIVPRFWLLTQRTQSRIFQQQSVPDILKTVITGLEVEWQIQGTFEPRDYCVQYRETDFAFASRLMEEEGIFYYFRHKQDGHTVVVANTPQTHEKLPFAHNLHYMDNRGPVRLDETIYLWEKHQTLRSGKVTLWDHSFELPHKNLEAQEVVKDDVVIGTATHKLKIAGNEQLELYDYPGAYAQRFDGISSAGGQQSGELQKIYDDNKRTAKLRMQVEAASAIDITGHTAYLNMLPGYKFELIHHYSDNDTYVITGTTWFIPQHGGYGNRNLEEDMQDMPSEEVVFHCLPYVLPYRPSRVTPKPSIYGTQTALVVGPAGEEIFTDRYGRVKVQFFWDRDGKFDGKSSCWVRVASSWAGKQWGFIAIPRIGQEVVVAFEEGDPDQPIIVGSVYNADQMPPHTLPDNKTMTGIKSRSTPHGGNDNLNEIRFEDKKGQEHLFVHAEKDMHRRIKASYFGDVGGDYNEYVHGDTRWQTHGKYSEKVEGNHSHHVVGNLSVGVEGNHETNCLATLVVKAPKTRIKGDNLHLIGKDNLKVEGTGPIEINSNGGIYLKCGGSEISLTSAGIYIKGNMVNINSGSSPGTAAAVDVPAMEAPDAPKGPLKPGETAATTVDRHAGPGSTTGLPRMASLRSSAPKHDPKSDENKDKKHWIELEMKDEAGQPVANEPFEITLPDGSTVSGATDEKGLARLENIDPGTCTVRWIHLDQDAYEKK